MPNHCQQDLTVRGPIDDVNRFIEKCLKDDDGNEKVLDCNAIISYPERFATQDAHAKAAMLTRAALTDEERATTPYVHVQDGYNSGGYEWCNANWGTKWGAYDGWRFKTSTKGRKMCLRLSFSSAWAPVNGGIWDALSETFPTLSFTLRYYEGGMGFKGTIEVADGEITESEGEYRGNRGG
jgi:hypothetical protein